MEELKRLEILVGLDNIKKINSKTILIIGLGGVGSYAVESLARSGVGKIIIVDRDIIDISNLNRQLMTLHSNIGQRKVDVVEERIKDINSNIEIIKIHDFIRKSNIEELFKENIDYVIDACDTIETKLALIKECLKRNIKLISCMGTGKRLDPTKLEITNLKNTTYDPVARVLRKELKDEKIKEDIMVVCSKEHPKNIEGTVIGSNSFVPATAGLLCTSYIINDILGDINA